MDKIRKHICRYKIQELSKNTNSKITTQKNTQTTDNNGFIKLI